MTNEAQRPMTWHEVAAELGRAQARIQELEAQAAMLAEALEEAVYQREIANWPSIRTLLVNLPQAAQRHLARDRAADRIIDEVERALRHGNVHEEFAEYIDAYRAASGELP